MGKLHRYGSGTAFKPTGAFLFLVLLGLCGNILKVPLFFGIDVVFGSIIVLIIVYTYGTTWGTIAAVIINSYTYIIWNHSYGILIFTIEALCVGVLYHKKRRSLVISDTIFWAFIGTPIVAVFYYTFLNMDNLQVITVILKNATNGIANALVAELIISRVPFKSWIFKERSIILQSIEKVFFNLILLVVLATALIITIINSNYEYNHRLSDIRAELEIESNRASALMEKWNKNNSNNLDAIGMSMLLKENSIWDNSIITIVDNNNLVIASNEASVESGYMLKFNRIDTIDLESGLYYFNVPKDIGLPSIEQWKRSFYVYERHLGTNLPWKVITQRSMMQYQRDMQLTYIRNFSVVLLLMLLMSVIAISMSRLVANPIKKLVEATTSLPRKLYTQQLDWPDSRISEINSLIYNFKIMSSVIYKNFEKINKTNEILEYTAKHDPLTKLPNKLLFKELIESALAMATYDGRKVAVIYIDVDRFKRVNDTFGHDKGDQLLVSITKCLEGCIKEPCTLFRIGGDEFVLLMPRVASIEEVVKQANDIVSISLQPYKIDEFEFQITISVGIALYPNDGKNTETLFKNADIAMYRAKESGRNCYKFYSSLSDDSAFNKLKLESCLSKALQNNEFILNYQPKVDIKSGRITGAEALIRWNSPEYGYVSPSEFIPLAEETGLIQSIGEWVLQTVCSDIKNWQCRGLMNVGISVNLSSVQVQRRNFINHVSKIIHNTCVNPKWLEFEITESTIIQDVNYAVEIIDKIKAMGLKISLDDFGTGFSSLNYLKNFKIDTLKIDSSFIKDVDTCPEDAAIVRTIISLARNLKLNVIAEGVETKEQVEFLKAEGCNEIQGYYFSKPLLSSQFEKLLDVDSQCM